MRRGIGVYTAVSDEAVHGTSRPEHLTQDGRQLSLQNGKGCVRGGDDAGRARALRNGEGPVATRRWGCVDVVDEDRVRDFEKLGDVPGGLKSGEGSHQLVGRFPEVAFHRGSWATSGFRRTHPIGPVHQLATAPSGGH